MIKLYIFLITLTGRVKALNVIRGIPFSSSEASRDCCPARVWSIATMVVYSNNGRNSTLHPETIYIRILCRMLQNDHALNKSFIRD